jgi:hypothetical protein
MSEEIKQEYSIENDPLFKPISNEKKKINKLEVCL